MHFAEQMFETKNSLEKAGHTAFVPSDTVDCLGRPELNMDMEHCKRLQIDKECFDKIAESDAILVLNYEKNGVKGYVGGATLMEIGLARHLDKRIFLLNDLPSEEELRYVHEIKLTEPIVLKGDLSRIVE